MYLPSGKYSNACVVGFRTILIFLLSKNSEKNKTRVHFFQNHFATLNKNAENVSNDFNKVFKALQMLSLFEFILILKLASAVFIIFFSPNDSPLKTEKYFLFHLKSYFRSRDIQIFVIFSFLSTLSRFKRTNGSGIIYMS